MEKFMAERFRGNKARGAIKDVYQSNGVIHVIDTVLMP
ncbi:fasciclin domain-containing protein [Danxiaibacter flavus]